MPDFDQCNPIYQIAAHPSGRLVEGLACPSPCKGGGDGGGGQPPSPPPPPPPPWPGGNQLPPPWPGGHPPWGSGNGGVCNPPPGPGGGGACLFQLAPADEGQAPGCSESTTSVGLGGTTAVIGSSPLDLSYTINLSALPADAIIIGAKATYGFSPTFGSTASISDDGGGPITSSTSWIIFWPPSAVANLNAAGRSSPLGVSAHCTWGSGLGGRFTVDSFEVTVCLASQ